MLRAERDLAELEALLRALPERLPALADLFDGAAEVVLTRAPGRLDVMGGIADYSGSLALELPLAEAACVAAARTDDGWLRVASVGSAAGDAPRELRFAAGPFWAACQSLQSLREYFAREPADRRWAAYVLGGLPLLARRGAQLSAGLRLLIDSAVPEGRGVGSSAALEVASLSALAALWHVPLLGRELGLACQLVENQVVGAPCGAMDQLTSACAEPGQLLALLCQPAQIEGYVAFPEGISVFGVDSGQSHAVSGVDYGLVRAAAFMGLRILSERLGASVKLSAPGRVVLEDDPLAGYLTRVAPNELAPELRDALPEVISGGEFLARFGGITDELTTVHPAARYLVRAATLHPIYEHARARSFAQLLPGATEPGELGQLGALMFAAHASYSACGLGSDGTDQLVESVRALGQKAGLFGAKISGAGSGGSVVILARTEQLPLVEALSRDYSRKTRRSSRVFSGSSPGAIALPARRLALRA